MDAQQKKQVEDSLTKMGSRQNSITNLASTLSVEQLAALSEPPHITTKVGHIAHPHGIGSGLGRIVGGIGDALKTADKKFNDIVDTGVKAYKVGAERLGESIGTGIYNKYEALAGRTATSAPSPEKTEEFSLILGKK